MFKFRFFLACAACAAAPVVATALAAGRPCSAEDLHSDLYWVERDAGSRLDPKICRPENRSRQSDAATLDNLRDRIEECAGALSPYDARQIQIEYENLVHLFQRIRVTPCP